MFKKKRLWIIALFFILFSLNFVLSYTAPDYYNINQRLCGSYTPPDYWNINSRLGECGGDIKSVYYGVLNNTQLRFACSPDNETFSVPRNQSTNGIFWIANNGTATEDIQIKYTGNLGTNWSFYAANQSDITLGNITLNNTYQTIWGDVTIGQTKKIWLWYNCSFTGQRHGVTFSMQGA